MNPAQDVKTLLSTISEGVFYKFHVGDRVIWKSRSGGSPRKGRIIGKGDEGGETVYDVKLDHDNEQHWGYETQFELLQSESKTGEKS